MASTRSRSLLFSVNFRAGTGYAWRHIEGIYGLIADDLATRGITAFVAYPEMEEPPKTLTGTAARAVELDTRVRSRETLRTLETFIRKHGVEVVYFTDRAVWSPWYLPLRRAGVRKIIVHDHTSGARTRPVGIRKAAKWLLARTPGINADRVIAVSEYVRRRQLEVAMLPPERVTTVRNGLAIHEVEAQRQDRSRLREEFGVSENSFIVACACRATPEKGVHHLLRAFDSVAEKLAVSGERAALIYCGSGPQLEELQELRRSLASREAISFGGYRPDALGLLATADVFAVPSVWQDALPLSVLEPMALGKPVVASRVGGIPEMVVDGKAGILVPPGDEEALGRALVDLRSNPEKARELGENARKRVVEEFTVEHQLRQMLQVVHEAFRISAAPQPRSDGSSDSA